MAIATDSAKDLHKTIGKDSIATFEDDPTFVDSNPEAGGSSENVEEQRDTDDTADSDEELGDEDVLDADDEDEDEEEDEFDDEDDDDEEDEDEEDDAEEVAALRADGLLGYEDEEEDVEQKRNREQGDAARAEAAVKLRKTHHSRPTDVDGDDDAGDLDPGIREPDTEDDNDMDTDRVTASAFMASRIAATLQQYAA